MPEARAAVDVVALAVGHVRTTPAVADLLETVSEHGVASELGPNYQPAESRRVVIFQVSSTTVERASAHVERVLLQVNSYGRSGPEAWDLWAEVDLALRAMPRTSFDGAVVTAVEKVGGPSQSPDPSTGGDRYTSAFAVTVHPAAA